MSIAEHLGNMFFKVINQTKVEILKANKQASHAISAETWSSLVVGDEQLDRTNSQTCMELCHECVAHFFGGGVDIYKQLSAWAETTFISYF